MSSVEKKMNRNTYTFFPTKQVTRKFHNAVMQNGLKEMYKKVCCMCKIVYLPIRPIDLFGILDAIAI